MHIEQIEKIARYHKDNWAEREGEIVEFNIKSQKLAIETLDHDEFKFNLNENASEQIYERLGIRGTRSDFKENFEFLQSAVDVKINERLVNTSMPLTKVIYDTTTNQAKAVKSIRYVRQPNLPIVKYIKKNYGEVNSRMSHIDDWGMKITAGGKDQNFHTYDEDDFIHGITFGNSETGNGALMAQQSLTRVVCTNGWITNRNFNVVRIAHIYPDLGQRLRMGIEEMSDIGDMIHLINKAKQKPYVIEDVKEMPTRLSQISIPKRHHKGIIRAYETEPLGRDSLGRINDWGIFNAITRYVSHDYQKQKDWSMAESNQLFMAPFQLIYMK